MAKYKDMFTATLFGLLIGSAPKAFADWGRFELVTLGDGTIPAVIIQPNEAWGVDAVAKEAAFFVSMIYFCMGPFPTLMGFHTYENEPDISIGEGSHMRFGYRRVGFERYRSESDGKAIFIDLVGTPTNELVLGQILTEDIEVHLNSGGKAIRITFHDELTSSAYRELQSKCG